MPSLEGVVALITTIWIAQLKTGIGLFGETTEVTQASVCPSAHPLIHGVSCP